MKKGEFEKTKSLTGRYDIENLLKSIDNIHRRSGPQIHSRSSKLDPLSWNGFGRAARANAIDVDENVSDNLKYTIPVKDGRALNSLALGSFGRISRALDPLRGKTFGAAKRQAEDENASLDYQMPISKSESFNEDQLNNPAYLRLLTNPFLKAKLSKK